MKYVTFTSKGTPPVLFVIIEIVVRRQIATPVDIKVPSRIGFQSRDGLLCRLLDLVASLSS